MWLTPTSGTESDPASARAAVAAIRRHGPSPGPREKATASIASATGPYVDSTNSTADSTVSGIALRMCSAAFRG